MGNPWLAIPSGLKFPLTLVTKLTTDPTTVDHRVSVRLPSHYSEEFLVWLILRIVLLTAQSEAVISTESFIDRSQ